MRALIVLTLLIGTVTATTYHVSRRIRLPFEINCDGITALDISTQSPDSSFTIKLVKDRDARGAFGCGTDIFTLGFYNRTQLFDGIMADVLPRDTYHLVYTNENWLYDMTLNHGMKVTCHDSWDQVPVRETKWKPVPMPAFVIYFVWTCLGMITIAAMIMQPGTMLAIFVTLMVGWGLYTLLDNPV